MTATEIQELYARIEALERLIEDMNEKLTTLWNHSWEVVDPFEMPKKK